jgi:hypothetical protein
MSKEPPRVCHASGPKETRVRLVFFRSPLACAMLMRLGYGWNRNRTKANQSPLVSCGCYCRNSATRETN